MRAPESTFIKARTLRRDLTLPEVLLWRELRGGRLGGLRFRRQHPIGPYVLDFYCADWRLAVEVDGAAHSLPERAAQDAMRDQWLAERGLRVMRFVASDILSAERRVDVLATIAATAAPSTAFHAVPLPRDAGEDTRGRADPPP